VFRELRLHRSCVAAYVYGRRFFALRRHRQWQTDQAGRRRQCCNSGWEQSELDVRGATIAEIDCQWQRLSSFTGRSQASKVNFRRCSSGRRCPGRHHLLGLILANRDWPRLANIVGAVQDIINSCYLGAMTQRDSIDWTSTTPDMEPLQVQNWLRQVHKERHLLNTSLVKIRNVIW